MVEMEPLIWTMWISIGGDDRNLLFDWRLGGISICAGNAMRYKLNT